MQIPTPRGRLLEKRKLADLTWLRVGGPADYIFQPADFKDLADFLDTLPQELSIFPIGVGSNIIVRDGGIRSVVIRLGKGFNDISFDNDLVHCGAAILDANYRLLRSYPLRNRLRQNIRVLSGRGAKT